MTSVKGKPDSHTKANAGDIYMDTDTGKKYVCKFIFRMSYSGEWVSEWEELPETVFIPQVSANPDPPEEQPQNTTVTTVEKEEPPAQPNRTNYNKQYNKQHRH